jgi:hypothetical protein
MALWIMNASLEARVVQLNTNWQGCMMVTGRHSRSGIRCRAAAPGPTPTVRSQAAPRSHHSHCYQDITESKGLYAIIPSSSLGDRSLATRRRGPTTRPCDITENDPTTTPIAIPKTTRRQLARVIGPMFDSCEYLHVPAHS